MSGAGGLADHGVPVAGSTGFLRRGWRRGRITCRPVRWCGAWQDYTFHSLCAADLDPDPFRQFHLWFGETRAAEITEPNAMTVATAGADGQPNLRTLLLKGLDDRGFTFFTNCISLKGRVLDENPRGASTFL